MIINTLMGWIVTRTSNRPSPDTRSYDFSSLQRCIQWGGGSGASSTRLHFQIDDVSDH